MHDRYSGLQYAHAHIVEGDPSPLDLKGIILLLVAHAVSVGMRV